MQSIMNKSEINKMISLVKKAQEKAAKEGNRSIARVLRDFYGDILVSLKNHVDWELPREKETGLKYDEIRIKMDVIVTWNEIPAERVLELKNALSNYVNA